MKKALFGGGKGAAVGAPSSSSSPPPASFPETVNVGGVSLSITSLRPFLAENPTTALSILLLRKITANPQELPFLDHNPFAFTVILDYFRYGRIYIPRNVAKAVVLLQMREFGIPFAAADVVDGESVIDSNNSSSGSAQPLPPPDYLEHDSYGVDSIISSRLSVLVDRCGDLVKQYAGQGYSKLRIVISSFDVQVGQVADKWEEIEHSDPSSKSENAIPVELICVDATSAAGSSISSNNNSSKSSAAASGKYSESVSLDMRFLIQADTMSSLSKLLQGSTGCRGVCVDCKECMLRITNEFGLLDSKAIPIVFLTIKIA